MSVFEFYSFIIFPLCFALVFYCHIKTNGQLNSESLQRIENHYEEKIKIIEDYYEKKIKRTEGLYEYILGTIEDYYECILGATEYRDCILKINDCEEKA